MDPHNNANHHVPDDYLVSAHKAKGHVQPIHDPRDDAADPGNPAANFIRQKLDSLYASEPSARAETTKMLAASRPRSKHQDFMYSLSQSGTSSAEIQKQWHNYYQSLPDQEKHEVWQEFYASHTQSPRAQAVHIEPLPEVPNTFQAPASKLSAVKLPKHRVHRETRSTAEIKQQILRKVKSGRKLKAHEHLQSLIFGLGMGSLVILILLFGFFNERFIAPFISPSRHVSSTPIIIDPNSTAISPNPEVIIPKINVEIPVVYDEPSVDENAIETALERGVVHYATTPMPGQQGNVVIFGHSSNNIFNPGKYKFAFVLLSRLDIGDTFYLTNGGKQYVYQIYKKQIVSPTDVSVMNTADKPDTATLITCDPPGTSINRLIVVGQQISPLPTTNVASTAIKSSSKPTIIPSNAPSLWQRFVHWL